MKTSALRKDEVPSVGLSDLREALEHAALFDIESIFTLYPRDPVHCAVPEEPSSIEKRRISRRFSCFGFAVVDFPTPMRPHRLCAFTEALGLGTPFVPAYMRATKRPMFNPEGLQVLSDSDQKHPAIVPAHPLHTDGACLKRIGQIQTSLQLCVSSAESGGAISLFHATAALKHLYESEPELVPPLFSPYALRRHIEGGFSYTAPAFAIRDGQILTRFTLDHSADWSVGANHDRRILSAVQRLNGLAAPGGGYSTEVLLHPGQVMLIANSRVCHGRTAYLDSDSCQRRFVHALFQKSPHRS